VNILFFIAVFVVAAAIGASREPREPRSKDRRNQ
jgi:hypothetical protein